MSLPQGTGIQGSAFSQESWKCILGNHRTLTLFFFSQQRWEAHHTQTKEMVNCPTLGEECKQQGKKGCTCGDQLAWKESKIHSRIPSSCRGSKIREHWRTNIEESRSWWRGRASGKKKTQSNMDNTGTLGNKPLRKKKRSGGEELMIKKKKLKKKRKMFTRKNK